MILSHSWRALALPLGVFLAACGAATADDGGVPRVGSADSTEDAAGATRDPQADGGAPPGVSLDAPPPVTVDEEEEAVVTVASKGIERFDVSGLPPGADFDSRTGKVTFRPDFTQSGSYAIDVTGSTGVAPASFSRTVKVLIDVRDSIAPRDPVVVSKTDGPGFSRLVVRQTTDTFLDSPGRAGRTFDAIVVVPTSATTARPAPVVVGLHGFGGGPNGNASSTSTFRIEPHDPENTYWWGYGESLPGPQPTAGQVPGYTLRRVLHLVAWLLREYPAADPDRVFSTGGSMGGAGALQLGLLHARHFAGVEASIAPTVPRNHRPSRVAQLTTLWGAPAANLGGTWDHLDLTRVLRDLPEARAQFLFTKHGKDDPTIHFGAVVQKSALTGKSFYGAIEGGAIGHLTVWDEGAHGPADPVLGDGWWDSGWSRITDATSYLTRRAAFPAFSRSSANENPGDGSGNGKVPFDVERGYSAKLEVAGDSGWSGAIAGAFNRFLRWDTTKIVDTVESLELPLRVVASSGAPAPKAGYPTKGDRRDGTAPITVDVTPRRTQHFRVAGGEKIQYRFGDASGLVVAGEDGSVTVPSLPVTTTTTTLRLERAR